MPAFQVISDLRPTGDQPTAIEQLTEGIERGLRKQVLLGVTGSGKTFTMANVIQRVQRPALILAPNKTLAAQLYSEFKDFFPNNAVEYFVSYYDYYQPEAYIPRTDTYIEKDADINDEIDKLRHAATRALLTRRDVIIVASVSCIYGLGSPEEYGKTVVSLRRGATVRRDRILRHLIDIQYERNDLTLVRGTFRVRGDVVDVFPAYEDVAVRVEFFGDEIERIVEIDPLTGELLVERNEIDIYPAKHFVTTDDKLRLAISDIQAELEERLRELEAEGKVLEAARLKQRTLYDLEMLQEAGYCSGIENYSRHLSRRAPGDPPWTLLDYFPDDYIMFIDESHLSIPQVRGMYAGDRSRKDVLVDYGFRLPSARDNRPLTFDEFERHVRQVVYVSATGATTVHNLAYAQRLGLWGGEDFPFGTRAEFVEAIEAGGVAAMEVLARDLRALGLYTSRSLSYDGVEYELVEHQLTGEQRRIYDAYAGAFAVIHNNLDAAMEAANITGSEGTLNRQAKSAARSAFESTKQRFFGHLLTSMKTPTLLRYISTDLEAGHAAVIQIVSTGEALMERRLAEIPTEEWNDLNTDLSPREYVLSYLQHSFPVQLYEPYTDSEGNLLSRPVFRDGQPVESREAVARRDEMIEHLASLPPVPGALDQIVQHFGTDMVAEVTGRSRRIVRKGEGPSARLAVENRAASANLAETSAFMDDQKRILVFSDAGGTGRSYHAELSARNQRLRVHYLLEPGWKADAAIQGLGRTNRTNQAQPPLFRPIATDVKAEKRFLSTIARRLDTLGAITRGQRQTGGQGLFRPEDNLESPYARDALRQLYLLIVRGKVEGCSLERFESATGLKLMDSTGIKDELPPITTFLNRLLALTIELQGILFTAFEQLLEARIDGAIASGSYDMGLETLRAERFTVLDRQVIYTHSATGAETRLLTITERKRNQPVTLNTAMAELDDPRAKLLVNERSGRVAVQIPTTSVMLDDGEIERRVRLIRPMEAHNVPVRMMGETHWVEADRQTFGAAWNAELAGVPEFTDTTLHLVTGLWLLMWKRLQQDSTRVYRLQTDEGERIIGRRVSLAWAADASVSGVPAGLTPDAAYAALMEGHTTLELAEGLQLRRARLMGTNRIELSGFTDTMRERLRAYGLFSEIISWKLRFFVPTDAQGPAIIDKLFDRWPVERIGEREAA